MPLEHEKSKEAFQHNIKAEMKAGKPMKQSLAIAYAMKRKKKAMGGEIEHEEKESGYLPEPKEHEVIDEPVEHEDEKDFNQHLYAKGDMVKRIMHKMYAKGGVVADEGEGEESEQSDSDINDFDYLSTVDLDDSTTNSGKSDGDYENDHDIVHRVMKKKYNK
jgi:hypothetical protein